MKENLYQYFGCDTKEELYILVKKNDESVRELIDYLNSKEDFNLDASNRIRDIDDIKRVIQNGEINIPNKDEITFLTLDAGCTIIDNKTFNFNNNTLYDVAKSLYSDKMTYFISVIGENFEKEAKNIRSDFISLGYREIEAVIKKNEHDFYIKGGDKYIHIDEVKKYREENKSIYKNDKLSQLGKYDEFMNFYSEKELMGKNILTQKNEIKQILRVANQHLSNEQILVMQHDKNFNIIDFECIAKGGNTNTSVDLKKLTAKLLDENVIGISIAHNHPSGYTNPSRADIIITKEIDEVCNKLNKYLIEHLIIGSKEKAFSFSDDERLISNRYKAEIEKIKDKEILLGIVKQNPGNLTYMNPEYVDKETALAAVRKDANLYIELRDELRKDKDIALATINNNKKALNYIDDTIYKDLAKHKEESVISKDNIKTKENPWKNKINRNKGLGR